VRAAAVGRRVRGGVGSLRPPRAYIAANDPKAG
jgi:hypothetical protein